jgi:hypothetical protein
MTLDFETGKKEFLAKRIISQSPQINNLPVENPSAPLGGPFKVEFSVVPADRRTALHILVLPFNGREIESGRYLETIFIVRLLQTITSKKY